MSISISHLTKYLGPEVQLELASNLAQKLPDDVENVRALYDLLDVVDLKANPEIYTHVHKYFTDVVYSSNTESYEYASQYIQSVPQLRLDILGAITASLTQYIHQNINWFIPEFSKILNISGSRDESAEVSNELVISLFGFLGFLFTRSEKDMEVLDPIILMFLGINDDSISSSMTQLLRWRIDDITKSVNPNIIWDIIFTLEGTDIKSHKSNGFILWLRYLNNPNFSADQAFENVVATNNYWKVVQEGLSSVSHEHRKFCLSILQLSVQNISINISNNFLTWEVTKSAVHLKEWSRYTTLFEVMGIDTSLHQADAGSKDIIGLISSSSLIHPSWGFCLLSTGFKATMDSVKKFSLNLLLSIPPEHLHLMKFGLPFLEQIYLPYAMSASLYIVRNHDGFDTCDFGERMTSFIASLVANLHTNEEFEVVVASILQVLVNLKESFGPARIYVSRGIVKGLGQRQVLRFGIHDKILLKLFENTSEGEVFETACQTLNLQILLRFELSESLFIDVLNKFVKINGYGLVRDNLESIKAYFNSSDDLFECLKEQVSDDNKIFLLPLIEDKKLIPYVLTQSRVILVKILESGFDLGFLKDERIIQAYSDLYNSDALLKDEDVISSLSKVRFQSLPGIKNSHLQALWNSLEGDLNSNNYHTITVAVEKFRLFNNLVGFERFFQSYSTVTALYHSMLSNSVELTKSIKDFYKTKDAIYGEYFTLLEICSNFGLFEEVAISDVLELVNSNSSDYRSNLAMVQLMQNYIVHCNISENEVEQITMFLSEMWSNLDSSRLQLNQKDLHILFINTLYNSKFLAAANSNGKVCQSLTQVGLSIVENSQGRRSLLPALANALSLFQIQYRESFESSKWIPEILVGSMILFQLRSNVFKLEKIIGQFFDEEISCAETNLYQSAYGPDEVSAKVWLLTILNSIKSSDFANEILLFILNNERKFYFLQVNKSTDGLEEWTRIQLFSIIISIMDLIDFDQHMETFIKLLETDPSPLARAYVEWIVSFKLLNSEKYTKFIFDSLSNKVTNLKPSVVTSYQRSLFLMVQHLESNQESEFISQLLSILVPGATSNKASTRHFSLSLLMSVYDEIQAKQIKLNSHISEMLDNMHKSALKSDAFGVYRSGDALLWNIKRDLSLVGISGGVLMRISDRDEIEFIPRKVYLDYLSTEQISLLNHPIGEDLKNLWVKERKIQKKSINVTESSTQSPLQTKSGAWNTIMDVDVTARGSDIVRSDLIVVSSLVDKPPNLGGICRLSDVLGAGLLTLNDLKAKTHPQFKNVAVTADQWMPMIEVKVEEIKNYLQEKKREGYTLIGLEQTDKSVELNSELKFPKKSLILLGREKEGVPGDLLAELDMCVEIKQVGVIRSMNIQTATAIIVHAYSSQHC